MEEKIPKCFCGRKDEGEPMREVGDTGKTIYISGFVDGVIKPTGVRIAKLYQCDLCKRVEIY